MPININHTPAGTATLTAPASGTPTVTLPLATGTLANIIPRVQTDTSNSALPSLNTDLYDVNVITSQSIVIVSFSTNLTGTPVNGQKLWISITATGSTAITLGTSFEASSIVLPTTASTSRMDMGFVWNAATSKWRIVALA